MTQLLCAAITTRLLVLKSIYQFKMQLNGNLPFVWNLLCCSPQRVNIEFVPDRRRKILCLPGHDTAIFISSLQTIQISSLPYIQEWMISFVKMSNYKKLFMFEDQIFTRSSSLKVCALFVFYHLFVPISQHLPGEPADLRNTYYFQPFIISTLFWVGQHQYQSMSCKFWGCMECSTWQSDEHSPAPVSRRWFHLFQWTVSPHHWPSQQPHCGSGTLLFHGNLDQTKLKYLLSAMKMKVLLWKIEFFSSVAVNLVLPVN